MSLSPFIEFNGGPSHEFGCLFVLEANMNFPKSFNITNTIFENCIASSIFSHGALGFVNSKGTVYRLFNVSFLNNSGNSGGGIFTSVAPVECIDSIFDGNSATNGSVCTQDVEAVNNGNVTLIGGSFGNQAIVPGSCLSLPPTTSSPTRIPSNAPSCLFSFVVTCRSGICNFQRSQQ